MAKACPPEQYGVPLHLRGTLKSGGARQKNFWRLAPDYSPALYIRSGATAHGVYRSTVEQRCIGLILVYII